jgi:metallophosphoesterase superfamily enzyme
MVTEGKILVISDTHFGAECDETENEMTNFKDLKILLEKLEKIKPSTIILLGDMLDLLRVSFAVAWANAEDCNLCPKKEDCTRKRKDPTRQPLKFFSTLLEYANKNKGFKIIWLIGNHDHRLGEISFACESRLRHQKFVKGIVEKGKDPSEVRTETLQKDLSDALNLFEGEGSENFKIQYPHHREDIPNFGTVYFDHGHYADGYEYKIKKVLIWIYNRALWFSKKIGKPRDLPDDYLEKAEFGEMYADIEANLSGAFSLLYHSKTDDMVRAGRDLIWRAGNQLPLFIPISLLFINFVGLVIAFKTQPQQYMLLPPILLFVYSISLLISLLETKFPALTKPISILRSVLTPILGPLNWIVNIGRSMMRLWAVSKSRGRNAEVMRKKITQDEFTMERKKKEEEYDAVEKSKNVTFYLIKNVVIGILIISGGLFLINYTYIKWTAWGWRGGLIALYAIYHLVYLLAQNIRKIWNLFKHPFNYTYLNFIQEGNRFKIDKPPFFRSYIFGHTHTAGKVVDTRKTKDKKTLTFYNAGGFVHKIEGKTKHCRNSFILIDPSKSGDKEIWVYRVKKEAQDNYVECNLDDKGRCDKACMEK